MRNIIFTTLLTLSANSYAGLSAVIIAYGTGEVPVNSSIDIDAEYVAMSVSLSSDAKYASKRAKLISKLQSKISSAATNQPNIYFKQGVISLSPRENSTFSISKSYGSNSGSKFYILSKLGNGTDIYKATQDIYGFIAKIQKPEDTNISYGNTSLAIESPSKHRTQLITKIKDEISSTKSILGTKHKVTVTGLESPVIVRQKNDKQVTLFLDYKIEFSE